ncbi:FecR family protein [Parapedobacter lycopersici]|uniref:FecR family protein n=1 Tax=Parapedobacter lycopersici TaxID=1864939 RepID=UPI00333E7E0D
MQEKELSALLNDERFLNYCLGRNAADVSFWESKLQLDPDLAEQIEPVRQAVVFLAHESSTRERERAYQQLRQQIHDAHAASLRRRRLYRIIGYSAAIMLLALFSGYYFYLGRGRADTIHPGGNAAMLTLADGRRVQLRDEQKGIIAQGDKMMYSDGTPVAGPGPGIRSTANTIETPRGGQYRIVLEDGSKIWLNAASKLTYPTHFQHNMRMVEVVGEAYFEVSEDRTRPFRIRVGKQEITVLGTAFGISAYGDEPAIRTTLVSGKVRIAYQKKSDSERLLRDSVFLQPNQQSILRGDSIIIHPVDAAKATAWVKGIFSFDDESLESIMQKISRWYDVEVVFAGADKNSRFWGGVSRYESVDEVLRRLQATGDVQFKIEGRRVMVMK